MHPLIFLPILLYCKTLKKGKILELPEAYHTRMEEVSILPEGRYTVNVDGELYDDIPFEVKIVSDSLRIYR